MSLIRRLFPRAQVGQDLKYGRRGLRRSPGFALIAILTIGLGIGANSAIFSVVNAVVRRPLGYPQPERLMFITSQFPSLGFDKFWVSPPEFFEYREHTKAFKDIGAYVTSALNVSEGDQPGRAPHTPPTPPSCRGTCSPCSASGRCSAAASPRRTTSPTPNPWSCCRTTC